MKIFEEIIQTTDREKRQYLWLAFLQATDANLKALELSPRYKEIKRINDELNCFLDSASWLKEGGKSLIGFDQNTLRPIYESSVSQEDIEYLIEDMRQLFIPSTEHKQHNFQQLKEFVYQSISVEPIGIEQLYNKEGFALIKYTASDTTRIFKYKISSYANAKERITVYMNLINEFCYSISNNFEQIKMKLNRDSNLNAYLIQCDVEVPFNNTLIPVAKGSLYKYLQQR